MARLSHARLAGRGGRAPLLAVVRIRCAGIDGVRASRVYRMHRLLAARRSDGLTLIEMMVVLAMVATLVTISFPSFVSFIQGNRVLSEVNSMVSSLQLARSEAIKRGEPVSVCPSSDGASCLGANVWSGGWLVFVDRDADGVVDAPASAADLLQYRAAWAGTDTFSATPSATFLTYNRDGFAVNLPGGGVTLAVRTEPVSAHATRCIALNMV
ncbi:MAG: GspH/FimT family pseudopilin, partial [Cupriavidus sp.]|nr:GspH/FimT family pseudopilin [Cupriavidus sp.]